MRLPKAMLGALALALATGSIAVAQQGDKMVTAEFFASLPQSVGNITFTPDNRVILFRPTQRDDHISRPHCGPERPSAQRH